MSPLPPPSDANQLVLEAASAWFAGFLSNHYEKTLECGDAENFVVNPFLVWHLAKFIDGEVTPRSVAKALIYPRQLGTSITTSFGAQIQRFISDTLVTAYGSAASGIDIEFIDQKDGLKKFTQLKSGPTTINSKDVRPIDDEFKRVQNLLKTNGVSLSKTHFAIGIMFGEESDLNQFYRQIRDDHGWELYVGKDFWWRLTGDEFFMTRLIDVVHQATEASAASTALNTTIEKLSKDPKIQKIALDYNKGV
jgi:hypothetical protein